MHHHVHAPCPVPPHMHAHRMAPPPPHMNNGPSAPPTSVTANTTPLQSAHLHDHHPRRNPHFQANMQLQKMRQQHQHLNNNNNNTNKNNYHQQPQYNHVPHMPQQAPQQKQSHLNIAAQRHPSVHHHQTHPQAQAHMSQQQIQATAQHAPNTMSANNIKSNSSNIVINNSQQQQQTSQHQQPPHPAIPVQHQPKAHYYGNNMPKYNSANVMMPKSILQNPNRTLKPRPHSSTVNNIEVNTTASIVKSVDAAKVNNNDDNNIASMSNVTDDSKVVATQPESKSSVATVPAKDTSEEANKENIQLASTSNIKAEPTATSVSSNAADDSSKNNNKAILLSNEDNSTKNSKEKTPMCLVNELARFNKITHTYRLTGERGPAHFKQFTVTLTLGEEEYIAEGYKIKKAQHLAAKQAIEKTKYEHPVPKVNRRNDEGSASRANITPTVELNALAMKLGQRTCYYFSQHQITTADAIGSVPEVMLPPYGVLPPPPSALGTAGGHMLSPHPLPPHPRMLDPSYMRRNGGYMPPPMPHSSQQRFGHRPYMPRYHQRYPMLPPPPPPPHVHNGMIPGHHSHPALPFGIPATPCSVTLVVGKQTFSGTGRTFQQAKHDAAAHALQVLKAQATNQLNEILNNSLEESSSKSPISLVHEIGLKRNMQVQFKVVREDGPAHMRNFVTACTVGTITTEGEGNGKKISKKRAAEKMLEELKKLPPLTPTKSPVKHIKMKTSGKVGAAAGSTPNNKSGFGERRKRAGTSIKEKSDTDSDLNNPITRLIQLQQSRKEKEPVFEMIAKNGNENARRREFIIEVTVQGMVARGTGSNKKLAKRDAAQKILNAMGVDTTTNNESDLQNNLSTDDINTTAAPSEPIKLNANATSTTTAAAEVIRPNMNVPIAHHVPGVLILRPNKKHAAKKKEALTSNVLNNTLEAEGSKKSEPVTTVVTVSPETTAAPKVSFSNTTGNSVASKDEESSIITMSSNQPTISATGAGSGTLPAVVDVSDVVTSTTPTTSNSSNTTCTTSSSSRSTTTTTSTSAGVYMKDQLLYLGKLMGFQVSFSDYPKGNHDEFLTVVTLSTNPPQICHGVGKSLEDSKNEAAKNALKILSELGLDSVTK